jgi:hypothetical protein
MSCIKNKKKTHTSIILGNCLSPKYDIVYLKQERKYDFSKILNKQQSYYKSNKVKDRKKTTEDEVHVYVKNS